eukprot:TRINITY_DN7659_c0_g1_i1.p1 TRINITY_DN7659_c0_g1~~TRINITY_DN7659_c0_g1_i1.p1  ORF type:complete len:362 (+),score=39.37 TRINITY_DN7659_c0_g1_i1:16-1101(+)
MYPQISSLWTEDLEACLLEGHSDLVSFGQPRGGRDWLVDDLHSDSRLLDAENQAWDFSDEEFHLFSKPFGTQKESWLSWEHPSPRKSRRGEVRLLSATPDSDCSGETNWVSFPLSPRKSEITPVIQEDKFFSQQLHGQRQAGWISWQISPRVVDGTTSAVLRQLSPRKDIPPSVATFWADEDTRLPSPSTTQALRSLSGDSQPIPRHTFPGKRKERNREGEKEIDSQNKKPRRNDTLLPILPTLTDSEVAESEQSDDHNSSSELELSLKQVKPRKVRREKLVCHCGKQFDIMTNFKAHLLTHSEYRPYTCQICSKGFNHPTNLRQHMVTHSASKPYQCTHCDAAFTTNGNLRRHLKKQHAL